MEDWVTGANPEMACNRKWVRLCNFSANKTEFRETAG